MITGKKIKNNKLINIENDEIKKILFILNIYIEASLNQRKNNTYKVKKSYTKTRKNNLYNKMHSLLKIKKLETNFFIKEMLFKFFSTKTTWNYNLIIIKQIKII